MMDTKLTKERFGALRVGDMLTHRGHEFMVREVETWRGLVHRVELDNGTNLKVDDQIIRDFTVYEKPLGGEMEELVPMTDSEINALLIDGILADIQEIRTYGNMEANLKLAQTTEAILGKLRIEALMAEAR